jgi:hypothetical protein
VYTNAGCTGTAVTAIGEEDVGTKEYWAKWTVNTYSITYNLGGGTNPDDAPASYTYGTGAALPTPSKTGNSFGGWYTNAGCTGTAVTAIGEEDVGTKEYWAKWTVNTYSITYNLGGGTNPDDAPASYTTAPAPRCRRRQRRETASAGGTRTPASPAPP